LSALPKSPAAAAVIDESRSWLEHLGVATNIDDAAALHDTTNAQLALLIAGVACARALIQDHGLTVQFVAGHSVGAFAGRDCRRADARRSPHRREGACRPHERSLLAG
jgi:malonate decarboxylase epsilon subunit